MGIIGVTIWVLGVIKLLTKSDPPSRVSGLGAFDFGSHVCKRYFTNTLRGLAQKC